MFFIYYDQNTWSNFALAFIQITFTQKYLKIYGQNGLDLSCPAKSLRRSLLEDILVRQADCRSTSLGVVVTIAT